MTSGVRELFILAFLHVIDNAIEILSDLLNDLCIIHSHIHTE